MTFFKIEKIFSKAKCARLSVVTWNLWGLKVHQLYYWCNFLVFLSKNEAFLSPIHNTIRLLGVWFLWCTAAKGCLSNQQRQQFEQRAKFSPSTYENRHAEYVPVQSELKQKINHLKFNLNLVSTVCLFHHYFTILGENKLSINVSRFF
jgi:hypothetical protein